jgi:hypothetical protein
MTRRFALGITLLNMCMLLITLSGVRVVDAQGAPAPLRTRSLEIVDEQGRVRAFLGVLPANAKTVMPNGQSVPETVILRLMDPKTGRPSVKLATSEQGSGLGLIGQSQTHTTWAIIEADGTSSAIRLRNEGEQERQIRE